MNDNTELSKADQLEYYTSKSRKSFFGSLSGHLIDFIQTLVIFGAIFALIYLFVAQPHKVSGNSMAPTFHDGDYILTDKITYRFRNPRNGDVIVLKNPKNESQDFIKRILATPGDTIKIENNLVYVNGKKLNEPYLSSSIITRSSDFLKEGESLAAGLNQYYVLGDNREHSSDSRAWGPISKEEIIGKVFFRYFPPSAFGITQFP
jgi:signal peptidase I